ncbi:MAG: hypothetical protein IKU27_08190 [Clostridia bacterium]|nr:hypothetical protein [Clostridia bacterium]
MIDLHTHILPGMDDGAKNVEMSLELLRMQKAQGINTVALTSHFYPGKESSHRFLRRRAEAMTTLQNAIAALPADERKKQPGRLCLGAEVAWGPNLAYDERLEEMCLGNSRYMLLELPFEPWNMRMIDEIYHLSARTGITPIIAHLDRYRKIQKRDLFDEIFALGVPIQLGIDDLLGGFFRRRSILKLLEQDAGFFLASDCHNLQGRKPNLQAALTVVKDKLGDEAAVRLVRMSEHLAAGM